MHMHMLMLHMHMHMQAAPALQLLEAWGKCVEAKGSHEPPLVPGARG